MTASMGETTIRLRGGQDRAEVEMGSGEKMKRVSVPVKALPDLLSRAITSPEGDPLGDTTLVRGAATTRIIDPQTWKVNLFPDLPYALFETESGLQVVVRGYEATTKTLLWRPDANKAKLPTPFLFSLPRVLWVTAWRKKVMVNAWVYTVEQWPLNVGDETVALRPWAAGNVWDRGEVCWGSTTSPSFGTDGVNNVALVFFGSIFNDHIPRIRLEAKYRVEGAYANGFSLKGLFEQTTAKQTGDKKVGTILHDPAITTTLKAVIQRAAAQ